VSVKKLARVSFLENYTFVNLAIMSGVKSGAQGQLNGFTGDAGGNRLKKDAMSGRDLVPFFPDVETVAQSEKQNGNSVKVKVSRTNGTPAPSTPHILLLCPVTCRAGSPPPAPHMRRVSHSDGLYAGTTLDTPPSP
jgi:hypothetical protein